ncbi:hypothetical protein [Chitinophaga pinensis]|uniref:Uncharacterized protein n=1 Tax=Chitinophaga pinensis (strain ATCC 43595 / DSM 2588 / LMG 13176 / NBRC 15968 / NCIMB 11800 / UQM 2034) TaxID=485918 RepID=A0A979G5X3_CHIPD|nr:hypothetical protein [Chitinophaga pinensis]ACU61316.1 hypothetical protein Cpin_3854 [Chitinophaga pinensis DSM 2588]
MEEQKYYTPEFEDIRIGMDCELFDVFKKSWILYEGIISVTIITSILQKGKLTKHVRVPYLTKEQIEAEGWVLKQPGTQSYFRIVNDGTFLHLYIKNDMSIVIVREDQTPESYNGAISEWDSTKNDVYQGTCRCVNDLRLISKLLGI